ncbi:MAG: hypothetical protein M1833_000361 [Piccolia ochrophora]|nr:MAG: hypothetical protein M1833_000361 [Piccolia ochrophora]
MSGPNSNGEIPVLPDPSTDPPWPRSPGVMSPPPLPDKCRQRSSSKVEEAQRAKRISLSFPIQNTYPTSSPLPTPASSRSATPVNDGTSTPWDQDLPTLSETGGVLVALAAQERRVLELKEDLQRAEEALENLKRQYSASEAARKQNEMIRMQQLPSTGAGLSRAESNRDANGGSARFLPGTGRRRSVANNAKAQRKVISGNGHTRALSLLSPERMNVLQPPPEEHLSKSCEKEAPRIHQSPSEYSPDSSSFASPVSESLRQERTKPELPKEDLLRASRHIAEEIKEGLWTFIDDLRQATIGDEGIHGSLEKQKQSTSYAKVIKKSRSISSIHSSGRPSPSPYSSPHVPSSMNLPSPGQQHDRTSTTSMTDRNLSKQERSIEKSPQGLRLYSQHSPMTRKQTGRDGRIIAADTQSSGPINQSIRWSSSTLQSDADSHSSRDESSSYPSVSSHDISGAPYREQGVGLRDEPSWSSLQKFSPRNLHRTTSALMDEWERSLGASAKSETPLEEPTTHASPMIGPSAM